MSGRLALREALDKHAKRHSERTRAIRRGTVVSLHPLTVDLHDFDHPVTYQDDFEMSQSMLAYDQSVGLHLSDLVLMHQEAAEWVLVDVVSDASPSGYALKSDPRLANAVLAGDSRLTDARRPTAHAPTHLTGGSDALPMPIVTTANASTSNPTLSNGAIVPEMTITRTFRGGPVLVLFTCHFSWAGSSYNDFRIVYDGGVPPGVADPTYTFSTFTAVSGWAMTGHAHWQFPMPSGAHTLRVDYYTGGNTSVSAFGWRRQLTVIEY